MPEIGASLREARMRARIDITEAEADTKIRGKYLRALENEEWRLLPGPTFVRSFLRTYGDYLGLDGRLLVEEFKLRHEREEGEPRPIAPGRRRERRRGGPASAARARALLVGALLLALVVGLFLLGSSSDDDGGGSGTTETTGAASSKVATLRIQPLAAVYACVRAADGRTLADEVLQPGAQGGEYRSRRLRLTLGSGQARLVVNGRPQSVPRSSQPLGYEVTRSGARRLSGPDRPRCG
jgi:hypothetical protein